MLPEQWLNDSCKSDSQSLSGHLKLSERRQIQAPLEVFCGSL